jgi:hypothetical protein
MTERAMGPADIERLRRRHRLGHVRYVLRYGVASGTCMAVAFTLVASWRGQEAFLHVLPRAVLLFGIGGTLIAEAMWRYVRSVCDHAPRSDRS